MVIDKQALRRLFCFLSAPVVNRGFFSPPELAE
jgi:hypothetical protein